MCLTLVDSGGRGARTQTLTETYPDASTRADRHSGACGDVPLNLLHVNALKDTLDGDLKRQESGPGYIHFPDDLPGSVFDELTSEMRTESGWERAADTTSRNEAWDQLAMDIVANLLPQDAQGIVSARDPPLALCRLRHAHRHGSDPPRGPAHRRTTARSTARSRPRCTRRPRPPPLRPPPSRSLDGQSLRYPLKLPRGQLIRGAERHGLARPIDRRP